MTMEKYVRIKKIGEGSFGKALLVRSKENGKQMVVKEINMSRMQRKEREESRKEVAVLAQLAHPNVVAYKESFEEVGNLYIVMDYCDGGDLYGRINAQRGILFPEDQILDWFVQTCLAIKHIHDRKILHRDVKSQNIFLTKHGIIKLGDFGISKVLNSTVELARTCIGTPYYLSPEICENKPYNNKSDVWSLGCVLYELCTLKHAFEAGNMKNLVLKIIRGSYPPVPPRYTYELRSLIATLFKRSPRDRPSINSVLRKSILQSRIKKFLSESELADEFSHTVMHGVKIRKALPAGGARPLPPKPAIAKRVAATPPRYNPASVYAPSAARKSKENNRQSGENVRRPASAGPKRPPSGGARGPGPYVDLAKKRQELIEKEKKRRDEVKKKEQYVKAHQKLVEKQKSDRINKAREEGWRSVMSDTMSSEDSEKKNRSLKKKPRIAKKDDVGRPLPSPKVPPVAAGQRDRGNFDQYHDWLNKLEADRKANNQAAPCRPIGQAGFDPMQAAKEGNKAGVIARDAADKAKVKEEFYLRRREAAVNRARGKRDLHAPSGVAAAISPRVGPTPVVVSRPSEKDVQEQEYLARLRQIRLQNYNERKGVKEKASPKVDPKYKPPIDPKNDPELRKKKIEALRVQADERAKKLKEDLRKKRREAYEQEQKRIREKLISRPAEQHKPTPAVKPAPPMTEAMKAIGVIKETPPATPEPCPIGMTAAMKAIGAVADSPKTELQRKKEEILKRLNAKPLFPSNPTQEPPAATAEPAAPAAPERHKWGEVVRLPEKTLEVTGSQMEATNLVTEEGRKQWASPHGTVLNVLQQAKLTDTTESESSIPSTPPAAGSTVTIDPLKAEGSAPCIGSTFTVAHNAKGTVVIKKAEVAVSIIAEEAESTEVKEPDEEESETKDSPRSRRRKSRSRSHSPHVKPTELFNKVQLDEGTVLNEDDLKMEDAEESVLEEPKDIKAQTLVVDLKQVANPKGTGFLMGLTTGNFDTDVKLLRTCSEPDLSKLFKTVAEAEMADEIMSCREDANKSIALGEELMADSEEEKLEEEEDEEEESGIEYNTEDLSSALEAQLRASCDTDSEEEVEEEEKEEAKEEAKEGGEVTKGEELVDDEEEEEEEEEGNATDDEDDLETLRESMMSLLENNDEEEVLSPLATKKKKKIVKKSKGTKKGKKKTEKGLSKKWSEESVEDLKSMRETMKSVLKDAKESNLTKVSEVTSGGDAAKSANIMPGKESWQEDDNEDDDDYFEEEDMFSRLEESRAKLEKELGCDTFLNAYKTVQDHCKKAIHEDEEENMEQGVEPVSKILGNEHMHLYPSILQLVMADGVFTEDNE